MAKDKKQLLITCTTPDGKNGRYTTFSRTLANGKTETFGVELNTPTDVSDRPWVYDIWLSSYWNKNRKKTYSGKKVEENELNGNTRGSCEAVYEN